MVALADSVKASLTDDERQMAATIGEQSGRTPAEKVEELFHTLPDPLLTDEDVCALLANTTTLQDIRTALDNLVTAEVLESDSATQRPLDEQGVVLYRLVDVPFRRLKLYALEVALGDGSARYQFSCDGRIVRSIARVQRLDALSQEGHQRAELKSHIREIKDGIVEGLQVPNSILLALSEGSTVYEDAPGEEAPPESFIVIRRLTELPAVDDPQLDTGPTAQAVKLVEVDFPFRHAAFDTEKSALLVDGQQRTAVSSVTPVDVVSTFQLSINAVVTDDDGAKEVFALANKTRPIPTDFERALVGSMASTSGLLKDDRVPALVARALVTTSGSSPFQGVTKFPGLKATPQQVVAYNTLFSVINEFKESALNDAESDAVLAPLVERAFQLVKVTWPDAWGLKPSFEARLMSGVGLRSLAKLLVWELERKAPSDGVDEATWDFLKRFLEKLGERVVWTQVAASAGNATQRNFFNSKIRERQNTGQDITKLYQDLKRAATQIRPE